jgi:hypothetical protein
VRRIVAFLAFTLAAMNPAHAQMSAGEIAELPQDKVRAIQQRCAEKYPNDYTTQLGCEEIELGALRTLIERGSLAPDGNPPRTRQKH